MPVFVLFALLLLSSPAWAITNGHVSFPLAVQIDASASEAQQSGGSLARLVDPRNSSGVPVGKWIEFGFSKTVVVTKMTVINGWAAPGVFKKHGRIKTMELSFKDGDKQTVTLKDTDKAQSLSLRGKGTAVRMTVTSVYHGADDNEPFLTGISFEGYDPSEQQVALTGRYEGCVRSRSSSSWEGQEEPFFYCSRFRADDGNTYGCIDDLCFHPKEHVNVRLRVTGVVKPGNVLQVLEAKPVN